MLVRDVVLWNKGYLSSHCLFNLNYYLCQPSGFLLGSVHCVYMFLEKG